MLLPRPQRRPYVRRILTLKPDKKPGDPQLILLRFLAASRAGRTITEMR
jgi:hypothetical protein